MRILITGVPNVIKDSIVKLATESFGAGLKVLNFSDFTDAESLKDELDFLKKTRTGLEETLQLKLLKLGRSATLLVNGYCTVKTAAGYAPLITEKLIKVMKPDLIIFIEVHPAALAGREKEEGFLLHQKVEQEFATGFAARTGAVIRIIESGEEGARKGANELARLLKEMVR